MFHRKGQNLTSPRTILKFKSCCFISKHLYFYLIFNFHFVSYIQVSRWFGRVSRSDRVSVGLHCVQRTGTHVSHLHQTTLYWGRHAAGAHYDQNLHNSNIGTIGMLTVVFGIFLQIGPKEASHWEWHCGCGFSRGAHTFCAWHDRFQFPPCLYSSSSGKPWNRWHHIQGLSSFLL